MARKGYNIGDKGETMFYIFRDPNDYVFDLVPSIYNDMAWLHRGAYKKYLVFHWGFWNIRLWRLE